MIEETCSEQTKNVQGTFQSYHEEIKRRDFMTKTEYNTKYFDNTDDDGEELPFHMEDQQFIVFSLSHEKFAPIPENKNSPALRIYGAFPDQESALDHCKNVQSADPNCSLLINKTHTWIVGAATPERMTDVKYVDVKRQCLLKLHERVRDKNKKEFEENIEERKVGDNEKPEPNKSIPNVLDDKRKASRKISKMAETRDQRFVAMSIIPDNTENCEFVFQVYGCFEDEKHANRWIRNVAGFQVTEYDIDVITACEWIYPQEMRSENAQKEVYRSTELDKIMKGYKSKPDDIKRLEETQV